MYKKYFKRPLDVMLSIIIIPFLIPIITISAVAIKLEDGGPIFYLSNRIGRNKKIFMMYKLRSMKLNAPDIRNNDGSTFNSKNDSRLTKVGKVLRATSIDEIPQIINVIKGEMSYIGPRPDMPEAINIYKGCEVNKLKVRPGITGYNQAYFRNSVVQSEKFQNDVFYVDNVNFNLDIKILFTTIVNVLRRKNVNKY